MQDGCRRCGNLPKWEINLTAQYIFSNYNCTHKCLPFCLNWHSRFVDLVLGFSGWVYQFHPEAFLSAAPLFFIKFTLRFQTYSEVQTGSRNATLNLYCCWSRAFWNPHAGSKWEETFSVGSIKYHFIFMKVAPGLLHWQLVFSIGCNGMFAWSLTFLSCVTAAAVCTVNSQHKCFNQFPLYCLGPFA